MLAFCAASLLPTLVANGALAANTFLPRANAPLLQVDVGMSRKVVDWVTASTPPQEVLAASLDALRSEDLHVVYDLLSRARRLEIEEMSRPDVRAAATPERVYAALSTELSCNCPGLVGHVSAEVVASLSDPEPPRGRLPLWRCRVKVDGQNFNFHLSRQSKADPKGDPRDIDGFEECWFVWKIWREDDRGDSDMRSGSPPMTSLSLP